MLRISGAPTLGEAVAELTAGGCAVAVKLGGEGAILDRDGVRCRAVPPARPPVDTTAPATASTLA